MNSRYFTQQRFRSGTLTAMIALAACAASAQAPLNAGNPVVPDDTAPAAYLNCGADTPAPAGLAGIRVLRGAPGRFEGVPDPVGTMMHDPERVIVELSGLDTASEYTLAFTWHEGDGQQRASAVAFASPDGGWDTVLPAARPVAMFAGEPTWAHIVLPIPARHIKPGRLEVTFLREDGPDVTVSELAVFKRAATSARKRVLIVTGDDYPGHRWRETAPALADVLREDPRLQVSIAESPAIYASPLLDYYDATVLHFKDYPERLAFSEDVRKGLEKHVESGHGLVLAHFACGAFQEWDGFERLAGRVWNPELRPHDPHGRFEVRVTDTNHPVTAGMQPFETIDELYTCLDGDTPVRVLCEAVSKVDEKPYPMAFVREGLPGRVFHSVLGHDVEAFQAPGVRALYRRGAAWAAGLPPE